MESISKQGSKPEVASVAYNSASPPPITGEVLALLATGQLMAFQIEGQWRLATPEVALRLESQPASTRRRQVFRWATVSVLLAVLVLGSTALYGQSAPKGGSSTIPYQGYLEENGGPAEGQRFVIACLYHTVDSTDCVWTEGHFVEVSAGRFSMNLGSDTSLDAVMHDGGNLYLGLTVDTASNGVATGTPVPLAGKQQLGSVPYARRGAPGKAFATDGINVSGDATVLGAVAMSGAATVTGPLTVAGAVVMNGATSITGPLTLADGSQVAGGELTSDAAGKATWQAPASDSPLALTAGVPYLNNTRRRLFVSVIVSAQTTPNHAISISTAPNAGSAPGTWSVIGFESSGGGADAFTVTAIVPPGAYYRYNALNGVSGYSGTSWEL